MISASLAGLYKPLLLSDGQLNFELQGEQNQKMMYGWFGLGQKESKPLRF